MVIAEVNGEKTCKRLYGAFGESYLSADNPKSQNGLV
ncbi:MAG: hypothetical protein COC24_016930 [Alphaproteobacteria bacterium]|nr:hypothetical protein [Alphaproteobacteria bacterium]